MKMDKVPSNPKFYSKLEVIISLMEKVTPKIDRRYFTGLTCSKTRCASEQRTEVWAEKWDANLLVNKNLGILLMKR